MKPKREGCDPETGSDTSFHRDELGSYVDGPEDLSWYDRLQAELAAEAARKSNPSQAR
jgi:hypothetical protein